MELDHYKILGVDPNANRETIKQAYIKLAMRYHPDRNPDDPDAERKFKLVNIAYNAIKEQFANHYKALQLPEDASQEEIKHAYYLICSELQPRANKGDEDAIDQLNRVKNAHSALVKHEESQNNDW